MSALGYPYSQVVPTRWNDNDIYGHVNNAVHYLAMDTVINGWMIAGSGLDIVGGPAIGLCVESRCRYLASMSYPDSMVLGLRVARLGTTSVTWEVAISRASDGQPVAEGTFVHVFVDRVSRRPTPLPAPVRAAMERLRAEPSAAADPPRGMPWH